MSDKDLREQLRPIAEAQGIPLDVLVAQIRNAQQTVSVGGNVTAGGDAVMGNKTTIVYQGEPPTARDEQEQVYRRWLVDRHGHLPLEMMEQSASDASQHYRPVSLEAVYVALNTENSVSEKALLRSLKTGRTLDRKPSGDLRSEDQRPLAAVEAAALHRRLVLLGGPGSGKTTFGNRLVVALAKRDWSAIANWPERLRDCLPVVVTLRYFARWLDGRDETPCPELLCAFIRKELDEHRLGFAWPLIDEVLDRQDKVLLFLDGLDEVPASARQAVLETVEALRQRHAGVRLLITCRIASYEDRSWRLPEEPYAVETLAQLDREQIESFVETWYRVMAERWRQPAETMQSRAAQLRDALFRPGSDLFRLARNPLLLTQMALVHAHDKRLPDYRAELYEKVVDILVLRWDERRGDGEGELSQHLERGQCDPKMLVEELRRLAWEAHGRMGDDEDAERVADLDERQLWKDLRKLHQPDQSLDWAEKLVDIMRRRTGLLVESTTGRFSFPHRTFQEYLAGSHLACEPNFVSNAVDKLREGPFWQEVVLLAVGHQVHIRSEYDQPLSLVDELCSPEAPEDDDETGWRFVRIAGEVLLEMGLNRVRRRTRGEALLDRVRRRLTALVEKGLLAAPERVVGGEVLGKLGDPRFDAERWGLPVRYRGEVEAFLGFVKVGAGPFVMGSSAEEVDAAKKGAPSYPEVWFDYELGNPETMTIDHGYWIARYPVTVAQYRCFVEDSGYRESRWWQKEPEFRSPDNWDEQCLYLNRPVIYVSWFEARAYAAWLDAKLREAGLLPENYEVRLATEAEWEKAARDGRSVRFPWGNEDWEPERANMEQIIGRPSPVGAFPWGCTLSDVHDLAGNVWEWTLTGFGKYPYENIRNNTEGDADRVVRGGSWFYGRQAARCASRGGGSPADRLDDLGIRVVVSLAVGS